MTLEEWLDTFCRSASIAIDEALQQERQRIDPNGKPKYGYGFDMSAYLGKNWLEERKEMLHNLVRKALNDMLFIQPSFESAFLSEDPEEMAITLAPGIAQQMLGGGS